MKNTYIENRVLEEANYILNTKDNIRATAKKFGVCKSTVHRDMRFRLRELKPQLYENIASILEFNKADRHLRGGEATRRKFSA
jgi:putative DeoR family transcriptional regulator (stage III sporulation protein D)